MKATIGLVQMSMSRDPERNLDKAVRMVRKAADAGADIVCLPELFETLYFPQSRTSKILPHSLSGPTTEALSNAAKSGGIVLVAGSVYEKDGPRTFNTSMIFGEDGSILGKYRKVHLPQDPDFYEQSYFDAGDSYLAVRTSFGRIGVLICFDQWYPEPARALKLMGADMVFYPTAIGTVEGVTQDEGDWHTAWEAVQRGHAISNSVVVAAANRVGTEGGLKFWGGSFVYDQFGTLKAKADDKEKVVVASVDLELGRRIEKGWGFMKNRRARTYSRLVK